MSGWEHLEKMDNGLPYSYRIVYGDDRFPYEWQKEGESYMESRDFREVAINEFCAHQEQSGKLLSIIAANIQKKINGR